MREEKRRPPISIHGESRLEKGKMMEVMEEAAMNAYDPEHNADGIISLALAENTLLHDELSEYFNRNLHLNYGAFTYGSWRGNPCLRGAIANLMNSHFQPHKAVTPNHIVMGSGLIPVIANITGTIANRGDGILLAAPYYHGFDLEISLLHGVEVVGAPVPFEDMFTLAELTHLENTLKDSNERGTIIKGVILCNPHNPYGRAYPKEIIIQYCKFCEKHNLHLISDEIYALSVFPSRDVPNPPPFVSALSLDLEAHGVDPSRLHVLYGMSKDFNCNGFRVGALVTQYNQTVLRSMATTTLFMVVSSPASTLCTALLTDKDFLPHFLNLNRLKLQEAYERLTSWLDFHKLPYIPASAGHFLVVDMRPILFDVDRYTSLFAITEEQDMREREAALNMYLARHGVLLNRGSLCHLEAGWFRITFSVRRDFVDLALNRMEDALGLERFRDPDAAA